MQTTVTKHTIDKVTYLVVSSQSDSATDSIDKKVEKLIIKDIQRETAKPDKY